MNNNINNLFLYASISNHNNFYNIINNINNHKLLLLENSYYKENILHSLSRSKYDNVNLIHLSMRILNKIDSNIINIFLKTKNIDNLTPWQLAIRNNIGNAICLQCWADKFENSDYYLQNISRHVYMIYEWEKVNNKIYPLNGNNQNYYLTHNL
jgi:hypothetical protein